MLDFSFTPQSSEFKNVWVIAGRGINGSADLQTWIRPRGIDHLHFTVLGAGGAGATGNTIASGTAGKGGTGGGSGSITTGIFQAYTLPDILYLFIPRGPAPGPSPAANTSIRINPTANGIIIQAIAGASGTIATNGAAGALWTPTANNYAFNTGIYQSTAGIAGAVSTLSAGGTAAGSSIVTGGGGGGSTSTTADFVGGGIAAMAGFYPAISGGQGAGVAGNKGLVNLFKPFFMTGGGGGGSNRAGVGGRGGDGGFGCGGGGGGAGATGGTGGNGGDGLVIIVGW